MRGGGGSVTAGYLTPRSVRAQTTARRARTGTHRTLPSGPTGPPDIHAGACGETIAVSRCPGAGAWPLSPTPKR